MTMHDAEQEPWSGNGAIRQATPVQTDKESENFSLNMKLNALTMWMGILNARLLALLSLLGALTGFGFVMYDPVPMRLWGMGIYCILCLWPVIALHIKKG